MRFHAILRAIGYQVDNRIYIDYPLQTMSGDATIGSMVNASSDAHHIP